MKKRKKRMRRKEYLRLERKKKDIQNKVIAGLFLLAVFGGTAATLTTPKKDFSDRENRALQQFPKVTLQTVMNGEFESDYETYLSDQFPGRDGWIQMKTGTERLIGKQEIKKIYFAADDYLIESHRGSFDTELSRQNIRYLSEFVKEQQENFEEGRVRVIIAPNAVEILKEKLPENAPDSGERTYLKEIEKSLPGGVWFDTLPVLEKHKDEYLYYRTDHHWTTLAAFYTYEAWAEEQGLSPSPISAYQQEILSDEFKGTIESKVGWKVKPDTILRFVKEERPSYTLDYNHGQEIRDNIYDLSFRDTKDQYSMFFGGNQPIIRSEIKNGSSRKLLVLKDSYAHCFLPFTFESFSEVDFIDLRYFNESLREFLEQSDYTDLLILYNASGFAEDTSLIKLRN